MIPQEGRQQTFSGNHRINPDGRDAIAVHLCGDICRVFSAKLPADDPAVGISAAISISNQWPEPVEEAPKSISSGVPVTRMISAMVVMPFRT